MVTARYYDLPAAAVEDAAREPRADRAGPTTARDRWALTCDSCHTMFMFARPADRDEERHHSRRSAISPGVCGFGPRTTNRSVSRWAIELPVTRIFD